MKGALANMERALDRIQQSQEKRDPTQRDYIEAVDTAKGMVARFNTLLNPAKLVPVCKRQAPQEVVSFES